MMKTCTHCKISKSIDKYRLCRLYKNMKQGEYVRSECNDCERLLSKQLSIARKNAPSKPENCECCHQLTTHFVLDHCHKSGNFRGWICRNCNQGIGKLGDNLEGIKNALSYLNRHNDINI